MAQALEQLARQQQTLAGIAGVVRTMKSLAAVNAAPSHSGADKSISASATSTTPSTAGVAATTARLRAKPEVGVVARRVSATSARGPCNGSATPADASVIGCREHPSVT